MLLLSKNIKYIESSEAKCSNHFAIYYFYAFGFRNRSSMKATREVFGLMPDTTEAFLFTVSNSSGTVVRISNYGGIIQSIRVPDKNGEMDDVVLGFDELGGYLGEHPYIGTLVGRYANRIRGGIFRLEETEYQLERNNGNNHLHGGLKGFDRVLWEAAEFADHKGAGVNLTYLSHDMEEGYPGNLKVSVTFTLDEENRLCLDYKAGTDKPCPVNLTHHVYFNLGGGSLPVYDHMLTIPADRYVVSDEELIPTGEIRKLAGSPLDFRKPKKIGAGLDKVPGGFDHCYALGGDGSQVSLAARVVHPGSGRVMEMFTTEPGVQFYSSNFLEGIRGKEGKMYGKHQALCLEAQHYPDSPNHPHFPDTVLKPGETYTQKTIYRFAVE